MLPQRCKNTALSTPSSPTELDPENVVTSDLLEGLSLILQDPEASMIPPTAVEVMSQDDWNALSAVERKPYQQAQLKKVDPRRIPRTLLGAKQTG